jgi:hypothetical protein
MVRNSRDNSEFKQFVLVSNKVSLDSESVSNACNPITEDKELILKAFELCICDSITYTSIVIPSFLFSHLYVKMIFLYYRFISCVALPLANLFFSIFFCVLVVRIYYVFPFINKRSESKIKYSQIERYDPCTVPYYCAQD